MQHISSQSAADTAVQEAIAYSNDLTRALEQASDLLQDTPAHTTMAVAWRNSVKALLDLVRSAVAVMTQVATMWK